MALTTQHESPVDRIDTPTPAQAQPTTPPTPVTSAVAPPFPAASTPGPVERFAMVGERITAVAPGDTDTFNAGGWAHLAAEGFWRIPVPRADGGHGQGWDRFFDAFEVLATTVVDVGFLLTAIAHAGALRAVVEYGTPDQAARFLPDLMVGGVAATAFTEPTGGSDVARIRASASRSPWCFDGHKAHITNAPVATTVIVLGRIPELGHRDLTLFLLEADRAGIHRSEPEKTAGCGTSPTGDLHFDQTPVAPSDVLGEPGEGLATAYRMFAFDRALYAVVAASRIQALVDRTLDHAERRHTFGSPLADHQMVQARIAEMYLAGVLAHHLARGAIRAVVSGTADAPLLASAAKLAGTEHLVAAATSAMHIHGHAGFADGDISRTLVDSLGTLIAGGSSDIQRKHIFTQLRNRPGQP